MRWGVRGIGLFSTAVLARLLAPTDFGLVAMCSLVVALVEAILEFGVRLTLVIKSDASREYWDTAWTVGVGQGTFVAFLILVSTPIAVRYYGPRVVGQARSFARIDVPELT